MNRIFFVNIEQAGRLLGVSKNTAYEAVKNGTLPVLKVGKVKMQVLVSDLEDMLKLERGTLTAEDFE